MNLMREERHMSLGPDLCAGRLISWRIVWREENGDIEMDC